MHYKLTSFILLIAATLSCSWGCSFTRHCIAALRSTDHFISHPNDSRVLYEPGAKDNADKIVLLLPSAIKQVEEKQYHSFVKPVRVYVCESRDRFMRMYGADVRAGVLTKLYLSPRIFDYGSEIARLYLTHELSHLHLLDRIGIFKMSRLPYWFKEGLATYVSGGGGAHLVSEQQAIDSIRSGKRFTPNHKGGFIVQQTPKNFGLKPHMFYRQSMMFVRYLNNFDESAYRRLLTGVENGTRFSLALQESYQLSLEALWNGFLEAVKTMGG